MGVDVWALRDDSAALPEQPSQPSQHVLSPAVGTSRSEKRPDVPSKVSGQPVSHASLDVAEVASVSASLAELAVACLVSADVLMLVDDHTPERGRLVMDVFTAAGRRPDGDNGAEPNKLAFHWDGDKQSQWRALGAFVDKQIADHAPKFIICSVGLCAHLPTGSAGYSVIQLPELEQLSVRMDLKRELWQQIQNHQT